MLTQVKSHLILQTILNNIDERKAMKLIRYNKAHQKKLKLTLEDFKNFIQVKVEVIPVHWDKLKKAKNFFVNFGKDKNKFLVYFNDNNIPIDRDYIKPEDKVEKITLIIIRTQSLSELFYNKKQGIYSGCDCIQEINFIRFFNRDIIDMSCMFYGCSMLTKINFSKFITEKVKNMSYMFYGCTSLKTIDLSLFNTENVTNMFGMFSKCSSLEELDFKSFNTKNVVNMGNMFEKCSKLKNMKNFNFSTYNVTNMSCMFEDCFSINYINSSHFLTYNVYSFDNMFKNCFLLTYLDISYFKFRNDATMREMFSNCDDNFKKEMKSQNSKLKPEAFYEDDDKRQIRNRFLNNH